MVGKVLQLIHRLRHRNPESHEKYKIEVGWTRRTHEGRQTDCKMYKMASQKWEEIKRMTEKVMA